MRTAAILILLGLAGCSQGWQDAMGGIGRGLQSASATSAPTSTGFRRVKGSYVSGMNRICTYSAVGGDQVETVPATQQCPR